MDQDEVLVSKPYLTPTLKAIIIISTVVFMFLFFYCACQSRSLFHFCCRRCSCSKKREHIYELEHLENGNGNGAVPSAPLDSKSQGFYQRNLKDFNK